eukprot:1023929-Heterocapsa_arctica.AAC.2
MLSTEPAKGHTLFSNTNRNIKKRMKQISGSDLVKNLVREKRLTTLKTTLSEIRLAQELLTNIRLVESGLVIKMK